MESKLDDVFFIRLQASLFCREIVYQQGEISIGNWIYEFSWKDATRPFYIVHEWCCSIDHPLTCTEEIQLVDPDGNVEFILRMSPFVIGERFWDVTRNFWEVTDFKPEKNGIYEVRTTLLVVESELPLFYQMDPLRIV